jgi:nonsense-mediated mRNA decay protein 3
LSAPCYLCGEESTIEGLCARCYNKEHPLVRVTSPLSIITCKKCGSVKVPGGWKTVVTHGDDDEETLNKQIEIGLELGLKRSSSGVVISFEEENRLDRVSHIIVTASGKSHESLALHEERHPIEVRFSYESCDTCSMMSGGYYEAILQIRADSRPLSDSEEEEIVRIVEDLTIAEYGRNSRAFVSGSSRDKFGVDFWIGSEHLTKRIADEIQSKFLAERKENYKLAGQEKGGKDKFRVTVLVRLPRFSVGDFISVDGHPCQVMAMGKGGLTCYDLIDNNRFTITVKSAKWRKIKFLKPESAKREYMLVSRGYGNPAQIMDAETYDIAEIDDSRLLPTMKSGSTIQVLVLEDDTVLPLPPEDSP